jgi:hypothetical protein
MNRGFSPGKVWDLGTSVNIDCGLGNRLSGHSVKYGNLAAYNLDTGEAEYLYDIPDDYPSLKEEYADEEEERLKAERVAKAAKDIENRKKVEHLRKLFFDSAKAKEDDPRVRFNFYHDDFCPQLSSEFKAFADFDQSKDLPMAYVGYNRQGTLHIYNEKFRKWAAIPLTLAHYRLIELNGSRLLFGMSGMFGESAEVSIDEVAYSENIMRYKIQAFPPMDFEEVFEGNEKFKSYYDKDGNERYCPNGLATCDFFYDDNLYSIRVIKNPSDIMIAQITDVKGNILEEFIRSGSKRWNKG